MKSVAVASAERLLRARRLVAEGAFLSGPGWVYCHASTPGVAGYEVTPEHGCNCPDARVGFARRNGIRCVHAEVARIVSGGVFEGQDCWFCGAGLVETRDGLACRACDRPAVAA